MALDRAAALFAARPDHAADARLTYHHADAWFGARRDTARGIAATEKALELLRGRPPSPELLNVLEVRTSLLTDAGRPAESLAAAEECLLLIERFPAFGHSQKPSLLLYAGEAQAALGRLDEAERSYLAAIDVSDRNQGVQGPHATTARVWFGQFLLGHSQLHRGAAQFAQALAIVDAWPESATKVAYAQKVVTELLGACIRLGRLDDAQALAARAGDLGVTSMQIHSFAVRLLIHRAALAIERGEFDEARRDLDAAGASIKSNALSTHAVNVKAYGPVRVRLHADLGEGTEAIDALRAWLASSGRARPRR